MNRYNTLAHIPVSNTGYLDNKFNYDDNATNIKYLSKKKIRIIG